MTNREKTDRVKILPGPMALSTKTRDERTERVSQEGKTGSANHSTGLRHLLFSPVHYEPSYAYPFIIWLHAPGRDETELFEIMPQLSLRNYVAVAPRGLTAAESKGTRPNRRTVVRDEIRAFSPLYDWPEREEGADEAESRIFEAMEKAKRNCHLSERRIFLVGIDSGGTFALRMATKFPEIFAGAVSLGGAFPKNDIPLRRWFRIRSLPLLMTLGVDNPTFTPRLAAEQLRLFHTAGMSVSIRQYGTVQSATPQMFRDVNRWLMEQVTGAVDPSVSSETKKAA